MERGGKMRYLLLCFLVAYATVLLVTSAMEKEYQKGYKQAFIEGMQSMIIKNLEEGDKLFIFSDGDINTSCVIHKGGS